MNIFATSMCPYESAYNLCDKHLYSQAKEGTQMLVSGLLINGYDPADMPIAKTTGRPHKGGYRNHPATRWTANHLIIGCGYGITRWRYATSSRTDSGLFTLHETN